MKVITNDRFILNGVEEEVLKAPKNRDGNITFTTGGFKAHPTTYPLAFFEAQTGYCIAGLEPVVEFDLENCLKSLVVELEKREMTIMTCKHTLINAGIVFTNSQNSTLSVHLSLAETANNYVICVRKGNSMSGKAFKSNKSGLPLLIVSALEQVDKFITTKVQVITNKGNNDEDKRIISQDGFPCLFKNESLDDYFKTQVMPAGIVINAIGKYQVFQSFEAADNTVRLSHETKDYKTLSGAKKKLNSAGYDEHGKQQHVIKREAFEEDIRHAMARSFCVTWCDDRLAEFSLNSHGSVRLSSISHTEDVKFGFIYVIKAVYTSNENGRVIQIDIPVDARDGGNPYDIFVKINSFCRDINADILSGDITFDDDTRSVFEKTTFHQSQLDGIKTRLDFNNKMLISPSNSNRVEHYTNLIKEGNSTASHHKTMIVQLKTELQLLPRKST